MSRRITSLAFQGFRGGSNPVELKFDSKTRMVLIYGENGTGKSTIADAIEFIVRGTLGSLEHKSASGTKKQQYLPTIGKDLSSIRVEMHCESDSWAASHNGKEIVVDGEAALPKVYFLRRTQLLKLTEAQPAQQYNEFKELIDVKGVETGEKALDQKMKQVEKQVEEQTALRNQSDGELLRLWNENRNENEQAASAREWAVQRLRADVDIQNEEIERLDRVIKNLDQILELQRVEREAFVGYSQERSATEEAERALAAASSEREEQDADLLTLLTSARRYLSGHETEVCPVCERPDNIEDLGRKLAERISRMEEIHLLHKNYQHSKRRLDNSSSVLNDNRKRLIDRCRSFAERAIDSNSDALQSRADFWKDIVARCEKYLSDDGLGLEVEDEAGNLIALFCTTGEDVKNDVADRMKRLRESIALRNAVKQLYESAVSAGKEQERLYVLQNQLKKTLDTVRTRRHEFIGKLLDTVVQDCRGMYARLHPNERLNLTSLRLDPKKSASLIQEATFEGHDRVAPQGYFSESHLDTLGFCTWLAHAKRTSDGNAILVLDDVFSSVDAPHLTRILDLLMDVSSSFAQVIITTHAKIWRQLWRSRHVSNNDCSMVELGRWSIDVGIGAREGVPDISTLKAMLADPHIDRQSIVSKAGVLAEEILDQLTRQYQCSMPRSMDDRYTLKALCDGVTKLSKKLAVNRIGLTPSDSNILGIEDLISRLGATSFVRNQVGAHFNPDGLEIADNDARDFVELVVELIETLHCPGCGTLPKKRKDTRVCNCRKTSMIPFDL